MKTESVTAVCSGSAFLSNVKINACPPSKIMSRTTTRAVLLAERMQPEKKF